MLVPDMGKPVLPAPSVFVARLDPVRRIPVGALPSGRLAEAGAAGLEPLVQDALPDGARRQGLPVRPVHSVEQAEAFARPVVEVAAIDLETGETRDIDLRQIHLGLA